MRKSARQFNPGQWSLVALAALLVARQQAVASGSVADCVTPNDDGSGYAHFAWTGMTADLNAANAGPLASVADLSNLSQLMNYTGIWVDTRQPTTGTMTSAETTNLQAFIATGRRVVLIGGLGPQPGNPNYSSWNDAILNAVGGPTGTTRFTSSATPAFATSSVTNGVSAIAVPSGAVVSSGVTLFADRVATIWGPARNALVLLDQSALDDDALPMLSNSTFAANLAAWVAGSLTDGPCRWVANTSGTWQDTSQWQLARQPSVGDDAVFDLGSAGYSVTVPGPLTARGLLVRSDRVTLNLSGVTSSLQMAQGISIGQSSNTVGHLTLSRSNSSTPATVSAASLSVSANSTLDLQTASLLNITGSTAVAAGGSIKLTGGQLATGSLTAAGNLTVTTGTVRIATNSPAGTLNTAGELTLGGSIDHWTGQLDLAHTDLDVQTGDFTILINEIHSGYSNGTWAGNGITSSAAANDPSHLTALGLLLNNDGTGHAICGTGTPQGLFDGASPGVNDLLIKYTFYGDANLDGHVDGSDYTKIDAAFGTPATGWQNGDFNYDNHIDGSDYTLIDNAFNTQPAAPASAAVTITQLPGTAEVPEPAGSTLILVFGSLIGTRTLRRRPYPISPSRH